MIIMMDYRSCGYVVVFAVHFLAWLLPNFPNRAGEGFALRHISLSFDAVFNCVI